MIESPNENINSLDERGLTKLHYAVDNGNLQEVVRLHKDEGADLNTMGQGGVTALHLTIVKRHYEVLAYLVDNGAVFSYEGLSNDFRMQLYQSTKYMAPEIVTKILSAQASTEPAPPDANANPSDVSHMGDNEDIME
jgi:ankyrin repeat protein